MVDHDDQPDPWQASEGHVGAPAAPSWGQPAPGPPDSATEGAAPADPALWYPPEPAQADHHDGAHRQANPYGVKAWGTSKESYSNTRRYPASSARNRSRNRSLYQTSYRNRRTAGPGRPNVSSVVLLLVGLFTAGLAYPIFALVTFANAFRTRKLTGSFALPPARTWLIWTVVFAVLGVGAITTFAIVGAHDGSSSDDSGPDIPFVNKSAALGQAATVLADVAPGSDRFVPVTLTATALIPVTNPPAGSPADDTAVQFTVCAGPDPITPYLVAGEIDLDTGDQAHPVTADETSLLPDTFDETLPAGQCITGSQDYAVGKDQKVTAVDYGILQTITWSVPAT